jgi:hypothetical protein
MVIITFDASHILLMMFQRVTCYFHLQATEQIPSIYTTRRLLLLSVQNKLGRRGLEGQGGYIQIGMAREWMFKNAALLGMERPGSFPVSSLFLSYIENCRV